jgi:hypothetical protein
MTHETKYAHKVSATSSTPGFKATTLYFGTFNEFEVFNHATKKDLPAGFEGHRWLSLQKTEGHQTYMCRAVENA